MVLNLKKYQLIYGVKGCQEDIWDLTKKEVRILKLLSDGNIHNTKEFARVCKIKNETAARVALYRLKKKTEGNLKIKTIRRTGYRLDEILKIEV